VKGSPSTTMTIERPASGCRRGRSFDRSDLVGGRLALDFVNTVSWRRRDPPEERLETYADLLAWSALAGALSRDDARPRMRASKRTPRAAAEVLERARTFREALYRLLVSRSHQEAIAPADLAKLNAELIRAPERRHLSVAGGTPVWKRGGGARRTLEAMLWPIAWSAADLLVGGALNRIRICAGEGCGWLFLDETRNGSRRWCSMSDCGNRAKVRRHYARARARRPGPG
jgi:predicted RNA-binding Zn ribbon-like protein